VGGILTGCFAKPDIGGASGLFYGNGEQLGWQIAGILMTSVYSAAGTALIMLAIKFTIGLRVSDEEEDMGLDASEHGYGVGTFVPNARLAARELCRSRVVLEPSDLLLVHACISLQASWLTSFCSCVLPAPCSLPYISSPSRCLTSDPAEPVDKRSTLVQPVSAPRLPLTRFESSHTLHPAPKVRPRTKALYHIMVGGIHLSVARPSETTPAN